MSTDLPSMPNMEPVEEELIWLGDQLQPLKSPIMVVALKGLFDVANGASSAVYRLNQHYKSELYARIEPDKFFNFSEERPIIRIEENSVRTLYWPETNFHIARLDTASNDLLLVSGTEPHLRWKAFTKYLWQVAEKAGVEMIVTLGSFVGMEPHTRSSGVGGSCSHQELVQKLGLSSPTYQGPTGVVGVLSAWAQNGDVPVVSLRVSVPHYASNPPNPDATRSLLARLELITGIKTNYQSLEESAQEWRIKIDEVVSQDSELANYVRHLEERIDSSGDHLPTGEDLGAQIEAFLRLDEGHNPETN